METFNGTYGKRDKKRPKKPKKRVASAEEIANDYSLKFNPYYLKWEALWSDDLNCAVRFNGYEGGDIEKVLIATLDGISPIAKPVNHLRVRRYCP